MRAEDTLQYMMDFWGDIFPTRKECLNHLFCTIGNGYDWKDGELVSHSEYLDRWTLKQPIEHAEPPVINITTLDTKKEIYKLRGFKEEDFWYPLSRRYSYLYNYPKDIKSDWLKLIEETKELLSKDGIDWEGVED